MSSYLPLFMLWLKRDIKSRYAGSLMGIVWSIIGPLLTIALFYVLFTYIFKVRVPELASDTGFFYYLLAGILPWLAISEGIARSTGVLVAYEQFLQKQAFPIGILPATTVIAALLPQAIGTVAFIGLLLTAGLFQAKTLLILPLLFVLQVAITIGLSMALSILAVHMRDLLHAIPITLQFLFYATPVLYPISMVPAQYHNLYALNPFACIVMSYQSAFLGIPISPLIVAALIFWTLLLGVGGYLLFRVLKPTLGEVL